MNPERGASLGRPSRQEGLTRPRLRVALVGEYPLREDEIDQGGVQSVTHQLAHALARHEDVECHVICAARGAAGCDRRIGALHVHFVPRLPLPRLATCRLHDAPRLVRVIRALHPDVVHGQGQDRHGLASVQSRLPCVVTPHGVIHVESRLLRRNALDLSGGLKKWLLDRTEREVFRRAGDMILISPYLEKAYGPLLTARKHPIENPIDPAFFGLDRRPERGRLLFVGTVVPRKCVPDLVRALAEATRENVAAQDGRMRLVIAGPLPDPGCVRQIEEAVQANRLAESVTLTGSLSEGALREEYGRAEMLLLSSREETSPQVIAQAMACGLPVVASSVGGVPYMVQDGRTGLLYSFGDVSGCARAIRRLHENPGLLATAGTQARGEALARFHPDAVAEKTIAVYRQIVSCGASYVGKRS